MKKNKTMIVVFLTPAVLLFLGIFLYPIIRTVIMSFFKIDGVTDSMDLWKICRIWQLYKADEYQLI
mgnify:CR=1 FL=1